MTSKKQFNQYLTEAIYRLKANEDKSISGIQNDLGQLIGKKGSLIEYWRKGNLPHQAEYLEVIAQYIKQKTDLDQEWFSEFLKAGNHSAPKAFAENLFASSENKSLKLPNESLPNMAVLPNGSIMWLTPNQNFVGRTQLLLEMAASFEDQTEPLTPQHQIVALCGLGGIGKTQLASEFVHRYGQYFNGGVFWINCEEPETIPRQIARCGGPGALNLSPNFYNLSLDDQIQLVRSAWQRESSRLLIFDNCEDQALLEEWRPVSGGCRILLTSRRSEWDETLNVNPFLLQVLYRHESVALLSKLLARPQQGHYPTLDAIAHEIGDLPLALHMAGRYLKRYQRTITPEMYLGWLQEQPSIEHDSMALGGISPTRHVQNIKRTFALSYEKLDDSIEDDQYALSILIRVAQFAPGEPIWVDLLAKTIESTQSDAAHLIIIDRAFSRLLELGLVDVDHQNMMRMHRLVAQFVRESNPQEVEKTKAIIQSVVLAEASRVNADGQPLPLLDWHVHLRSIVDLDEIVQDPRHIRLCNEIGEHLKQIEDYRGAFPYFKQSVAIADLFENEHLLDKAKSYHNFGFVLRELSQLDRAYTYLSDSLNIRLAVCQRSHPATAESYNELGRWYLRKGLYDQAADSFQDALSIGQNTLAGDHALKADFLNNLGMCLAIQGKPEEGFPNIEQAYEMRMRLFGLNHPRTVLSLNNLGYVLRDLDRFDEAKAYYQSAQNVNLTIFGEIHPKTAVSLINLGNVNIQLGLLGEAKENLNRAVDIYVVMQNLEHLNVASCFFNLGDIADLEDEVDVAINYFGQCHDIRKNQLGPEHPQTQRTYKRLQEMINKKAS